MSNAPHRTANADKQYIKKSHELTHRPKFFKELFAALKAVAKVLQTFAVVDLSTEQPRPPPQRVAEIISPKEIKRAANVSSRLTKKQGYINGSFLTALASLHPST